MLGREGRGYYWRTSGRPLSSQFVRRTQQSFWKRWRKDAGVSAEAVWDSRSRNHFLSSLFPKFCGFFLFCVYIFFNFSFVPKQKYNCHLKRISGRLFWSQTEVAIAQEHRISLPQVPWPSVVTKKILNQGTSRHVGGHISSWVEQRRGSNFCRSQCCVLVFLDFWWGN